MSNPLYGEVILGEALKSFSGVISPITCMARNYSSEAINLGDIVKVPYLGSNSVSNQFNYTAPYSSTANLGVLPVTINSLQYQMFSINDCDSAKLDDNAISTFAKQSGEFLGRDVISASLASVLNDSNFPTSASCTSNQLTSSVAISNLVTQADNALFPADERNLIVSPNAFNYLLNNSNLNQAFSYGGSQVVQNGLPTQVMGLNVFKTTATMGNNCKGILLNKNAILFATGQHKPSSNASGLVQFVASTVNGITVTLKTFYDPYLAKTNHLLECLSGVSCGNGAALFQMK